MKIAICIFVLYIQSCYTEIVEIRAEEDKTSAKKILNITADIIKDTDRRIGLLHTEQKAASGCAPFEVGYLTFVLNEKYRRMVDKYNVSQYMLKRLYLSELVLYLDEIEHHYWEINHIANMLHEVERKYNIETDFNVEYAEPTPDPEQQSPTVDYHDNAQTRPRRKRTRFEADKYLQHWYTSTVRPRTKKNKWWPIDYGWEPEHQWFSYNYGRK